MRTIFRICRSESQPGLQPVERLATPLNYTLFLYNSHHWKTFLYSSFSFWTQLFYLTLFAEHFQLALSDYTVKPCNFQLDEQIFIHRYFRFGFDTWASILHLTEMRISQFDTHSVNFATRRVIFQTRPRIFSTQLWNFRFRSFSALSSVMLCEKRGSVGNTQIYLMPKCCLLFWNIKLIKLFAAK